MALAICSAHSFSHPVQADTLIAQASKYAANGQLLAALVYADAAIAHPHVSAAELRTFVAARDSYGGRWVLQTLDKLGPLVDGNADTAFAQLRSIKALLAPDHIASASLDTALARATTLLFARVDALEAAGDLAQAEALLTALVAAMGTHGDTLTALRARAYTLRTAQVPETRERADHAPTAMLHLQAAARYGAVPEDALRDAIAKTGPLISTVVGGEASGSCFEHPHEIDRVAPAEPGVAVRVEVQLSGCETTGPEVTTATASLPYTRTITQLVARGHIENKGYECHTVATSQGAITYTSSYEQPGCAMPLFVVVEDEPEKHELEITEYDVVATTRTSYTAHAAAHVVVSWPGGSLEQTVSGSGVSSSIAYGQPAHGQRPIPDTPANPTDAHHAAMAELERNAYGLTSGVSARLAAEAVARAKGASDPLVAEDNLVVAARLAAVASPELIALVDRRYHMTAAELQAALFQLPYSLPALDETIVAPSVTSDELLDDERAYHAIFLKTATGRSAYALSFDVGYARSTGDARVEHGAFVFAFNFFASYPDTGRLAMSTIADIRYGRGGLLDLRLGVGGGLNLYGVLVHPFVGLGFDRLGLPGDATTVRYGTAAVVEAGLRVGLAIPHVLATDATFARRRRLDVGGDPSVENRLDFEIRVQPFVLDLQYTQLSASASDLLGGPALAHESAQLVELLFGYGF